MVWRLTLSAARQRCWQSNLCSQLACQVTSTSHRNKCHGMPYNSSFYSSMLEKLCILPMVVLLVLSKQNWEWCITKTEYFSCSSARNTSMWLTNFSSTTIRHRLWIVTGGVELAPGPDIFALLEFHKMDVPLAERVLTGVPNPKRRKVCWHFHWEPQSP